MNREEKKQKTLQRIIEAADRLFCEKGFEETSVAEITQAAGVAKGTFFNYFATKEELLFKFQKNFYLHELFSLRDRPGPYVPLILAYVKEVGDSMSANPALLRSALQRFLAMSAVDKGKSSSHEIKLQSIAELFDKGQRSGEFGRNISAEELASTALQLYFGTLVTWSTGMGDAGLGDQLQTAFRVFLGGISTVQDQ